VNETKGKCNRRGAESAETDAEKIIANLLWKSLIHFLFSIFSASVSALSAPRRLHFFYTAVFAAIGMTTMLLGEVGHSC
jgi:hypothetical protein